jgi:hypothetical protein
MEVNSIFCGYVLRGLGGPIPNVDIVSIALWASIEIRLRWGRVVKLKSQILHTTQASNLKNAQ